MKRFICCAIVLCIIMVCSISPIARAEDGNSKIETSADNGIIKQGDKYFRIDPKYGSIEVTKIDVFSSRGIIKTSAYASLREETRIIIDDIIESSKKINNFELQGLEVYTDVLPEIMPYAQYVQNEQIIYRGIHGFQDWFTYDDYLKLLKSKAVKEIATGVSGMIPYVGYANTTLSTLLNINITAGEWKNTSTKLSLHEEKVIQLSWVYNPGVEDVYLGAQTQFATLRAESLTRNLFSASVSKIGPFVYFKTPNYQNPTSVAINGRIDTFVERLDIYEFVVNVNGRNETCYFVSLY